MTFDVWGAGSGRCWSVNEMELLILSEALQLWFRLYAHTNVNRDPGMNVRVSCKRPINVGLGSMT